jgi:hypothetical protein
MPTLHGRPASIRGAMTTLPSCELLTSAKLARPFRSIPDHGYLAGEGRGKGRSAVVRHRYHQHAGIVRRPPRRPLAKLFKRIGRDNLHSHRRPVSRRLCRRVRCALAVDAGLGPDSLHGARTSAYAKSAPWECSRPWQRRRG